MTSTLETMKFDNLSLRALPLDPVQDVYPRRVPNSCFSRVAPTPLLNPRLVAVSPTALALLDIPESELERSDLVLYLSGNKVFPGSEPAAHCYCGHQFGYFSGQLGDGATMYLGEVVRDRERWEVQFKGAGRTPYSRTADGRKVLRSSIREFLCSEANHFLGVPTTRAGSVVTSDSRVERDILYNGNVIRERCSVVVRIAPTFLRFGSFEIFKGEDETTHQAGPSAGNIDLLRTLYDHVCETYFPEFPNDSDSMYVDVFREIVHRTAKLVAKWQTVGFCHGVLNTDNMSIIGVTLDYGPFGFMEFFDFDFVCNRSDSDGRYSYKKQPEMCRWNCTKLAEAVAPLIGDSRSRAIVDEFDQVYHTEYYRLMSCKLSVALSEPLKHVCSLLFETMNKTRADFTETFVALEGLQISGSSEDAIAKCLEHLRKICAPRQHRIEILQQKIRANTPRIPPELLETLKLLSLDEIMERFGRPREQSLGLMKEIRDEATKLDQIKTLHKETQELRSCTDQAIHDRDQTLWKQLLLELVPLIDHDKTPDPTHNPRFVLRNWIAQQVITSAEAGDYQPLSSVLKRLESPFSDSFTVPGLEGLNPDLSRDLCVS